LQGQLTFTSAKNGARNADKITYVHLFEKSILVLTYHVSLNVDLQLASSIFDVHKRSSAKGTHGNDAACTEKNLLLLS
jgi:hypothetical protein